MSLVKFPTPPHFSSGRLERIGFLGHCLYVGLRIEDRVEIWCVHCLTPSSWRQVYVINTEELFYAYFTISAANNCIYGFIIALFEKSLVGEVAILQINLSKLKRNESPEKCVDKYVLSNECSTQFEEISLESVGLGFGETNGLFIFDRSMVMGKIPFWRIKLNDLKKTFLIENCAIGRQETEELKCCRFPVVINGDKRLVLRLTNDNEVNIYDSELEKWIIYWPDENSDLNLNTFHTRGISETFGHDWHRCSVIESPLSVFAENGSCIFKVYNNNQHRFYTFSINKESNTYCLKNCSSIKIEKRLEAMFYLHCAEGKRIAFVNKHLIGFTNIQPPTLRESSFWAFQQIFAFKNTLGLWCGGKSEEELRQIFHINSKLILI